MDISRIIIIIALALEYLLFGISNRYYKKGCMYCMYKEERNLCFFGMVILAAIAVILCRIYGYK